MGREERNRQVVVAEAQDMLGAHRDNLLGRVLEFDAHKGACPKCNHAEIGAAWCPGKIHTLPVEVRQTCQADGEHLHRQCKGCGFEWRERCMDHEEA